MVRGGFGLLEFVAALALVAIAMGWVTTQVVHVVRGTQLAGTCRSLSSTLRVARGRALASGQSVDVRFDVPGRRWETIDLAGGVHDRQTLPTGITFATVPARRRVRFSAIGTADNATITLVAGGVRRQVVVNQRGRVVLR